MRLINRLPLFWKVLAPALLAIVCFGVYVGASSWVTEVNNRQLNDTRDAQYPALDTVTENVSLLDRVIAGLNGAAAASDADMVAEVDDVATKVHANFARIKKLVPEDGAEVAKLDELFNTYYALATAVTKAMTAKDGGIDTVKLQQMNIALGTYRTALNKYRTAAKARFDQTIDPTIKSAKKE